MPRRWQLHRNKLCYSRTRAQETLRSYGRRRERKDSPLTLRNHCDGAQWQAGISCEVGQRLSVPPAHPSYGQPFELPVHITLAGFHIPTQ